ncbi:DUF6644 family protein [Larkinella soli]|uniref:DUF6644 family protein n=1 Tax=Larkinella soli TaxID=1770527 RepID=UPI000FFC54B5|nr:DUF6644 family protein [Larkinella soli]
MEEGLAWLEKTAWAVAIRQSDWLYPWLEIIHILGIVLLVGTALLFDLRLLGYARPLPVTGLARYLLPWSRRGLALVIPTGLLLFTTNAVELGRNPTFWLKMSLLVIAGLNVAVFHRRTFRSVSAWPDHPTPLAARLAAVCSILVWVALIACGRLLAY